VGPGQVRVEGRLCVAGHLTDPTLDRCVTCGQALSERLGAGPRPSLGRLIGPGIDVLVERDMLLGRKPQESPEVAAGQLAPVATPSGESAVSRLHAELRLDGWTVLLADRASANGTFIRPPGAADWIRLEPYHAVRLMPGTEVMVGPVELRFSSLAG